MSRHRYQITEVQRNELTRAYATCKDGPTRTRYQAVRLYGEGYPEPEVERITGCSRTSLLEWWAAYRKCGLPGLVDKRLGGNRAKLTPLQIEELGQRLHLYTPRGLFGPEASTATGQFWTVPDLHRAVQKWYEVGYRSRSSYCRLFGLCEFSYQRPEKVFKPRNQLKVAEFEEQVEKN